MVTKCTTPIWAKKAKKKLLDRQMSQKMLAETLKVNYRQLNNVLSGYVVNTTIEQKICKYLEIKR